MRGKEMVIMLMKILMFGVLIAITLYVLYCNEVALEEEAEIKKLYKEALEDNKRLLNESLERLA